MHNSLLLENLSKIPISYRRHATAALTGTLQDLIRLVLAIPDSPHAGLFLPVFYEHLDPDRIPTIDQLDSYTASTNKIIAKAIFSLRGIGTLSKRRVLSAEVASDLWRRIWPWIQFKHTYGDCLPNPLVGAAEAEAYALYISLILLLRMESNTADMIDRTPGVKVVISRAWLVILNIGDRAGIGWFDTVCRVLHRDLMPADGPNFAELIEGAGGSQSDLAALMVRHLDRVVPGPDCTLTEEIVRDFGGLFRSSAPHLT
ncbi:hypothetical protein B0H10DRAFT_2223052 [Mycena sp. CBHHK59/15]|nr:hypothetical protein B0H10DRAFT_2223052 [Mycena sp. CBHHK59/15]